ncbi:hypothetical protein BG842_07990 [Haladaptatus sp. W1]|nr:hypothetical protein BG842_07990 [Haladaptatus sp. W1]
MNRPPSDEPDESPKTTETRRAVTSRRSLLLTGGALGLAMPGVSLRALGNRGQRGEQHENDTNQWTSSSADSHQDTQQSSYFQKLAASDGTSPDWFGHSIARSGNTAIIGAQRNNDNGAAYVFQFDGSQWTEKQKLTANDGTAYDSFGASVAVSDDVALIGAPNDDDNGSHSGAAYVFRFDGCEWTQEQKLTPCEGASYVWFSTSMGVSDGVALIGAPGDDDNGNHSGAAYVFQFDGSQWTQEQKLTASDGTEDDNFGRSIAKSSEMAIIGAPGNHSGAAYVFQFDGSQWTEKQKLTANDGTADDGFGFSVAVSDDVAFISAFGDDDNGTNSGSAYVFRFDGSQWTEKQKLTANDGTADDRFGASVAVSDDVALIGAYYGNHSGDGSGAVYVFRFDGSQWSEMNKLVSNDSTARDLFGASVAVSDDVALIGAPYDDENGISSGAAYVFHL